MSDIRIKYDSQIISNRLDQLFEHLRNAVTESVYENEAVTNIYTRFQEFFTTFGKPSFKLREAVEGSPPWGDDLNAMMLEAVADVAVLFNELNTLASSVQSIYNLSAADTATALNMILGIEKLLEDYQVYIDEVSEDLYVGDSFNDTTLISDTTCTVDTGAGLISLKVLDTINYAQQAQVRIHGGTENSFPGNLLQGVSPTSGESEISGSVNPNDYSKGASDTSANSGGVPVIEKNEVQMTADLRGENKYPEFLVDGKSETMFEYEMMVVPNHVYITQVNDKVPYNEGCRGDGGLIPEVVQKLQEQDPSLAKRHPMLIVKEGDIKTFSPVLPGHGNNPNIQVCSDKGWSYTMGYGWKYRKNDTESVYKVRFVDKDWRPDEGTKLEVNIEFEFQVAVNITSLRIDPGILQDISSDYNGADHFTLTDVAFLTQPVVGGTIPQVLWGSDLGMELPLDLYGSKTLTFPQQRVHSIVLQFTCDNPYACQVVHPYIERQANIAATWEKGSGGFSFWRVKHGGFGVWLGDRYDSENPAIYEILPFAGEGVKTGSSLAEASGFAVPDWVGTLIIGAYASAGNLGGDMADLAANMGWSETQTVGAAFQNIAEQTFKDQITGAVGDQVFSGGANPGTAGEPGGFAGNGAGMPGSNTGVTGAGSGNMYSKRDPVTGEIKWYDTTPVMQRQSSVENIELGWISTEKIIKAFGSAPPDKNVDGTWVENNIEIWNGTRVDVEYKIQSVIQTHAKDYMDRVDTIVFEFRQQRKTGKDGYKVFEAITFTGGTWSQGQSTDPYSYKDVVTGQEILKKAPKQPRQFLREKLAKAASKSIFDMAGHAVAEVINCILGGLKALFMKKQAKLTGVTVVGENIYYGLEGYPGYRYWIALREIALESNVYATGNYMISQFFGGTSLLITVGVMLDTMRQVESYLLSYHYDGFLSNGHLRSRRT